MPPFSQSKRTAQNAAQAINELESVSQELSGLKDDLRRTQALVQGLWELYKKETGKTDDDLSAVVAEVEERMEATRQEAETCESCGRHLQKRSKACIYCGTLVTKRRLFH